MPDDVKSMAVKMASMGLSVFFVQPDGKRPAQKAFYEKASNDPQIVAQRFTDVDGTSVNYNLGVLAGAQLSDGRKLHVIDVDAKDGKKGLDSLEELKLLGLNTDTLTVKTPSGGLHLYYATPPDWPELGNTAGKLGEGIDTRGHHGYVVGAGSTIGEKPYELIRNGEIRTLEPWMLEHLKIRVDKPDQSHWLCEPDLPENVARAAEHCRAYPTPEEGTRNNQMLVLAKDMRKFGISKDMAFSLMYDNWALMEDRTLEDELEKTVRSAYEGAQYEPAGVWTAGAQFEDIHSELDPTAIQSPIAIAKSRFTFETVADLRKLPPLKWLVGGWMQDGGVGVVYGRYGSGKSFMMFDLALHLAHGGREWHSYSLPGIACDVLVIASEGKDGFIKRIDAFKTAYGIQEDQERMVFMRQNIDLMNATEFRAFSEAIKESGRKFRLVIIDTVQRTIPGLDQNTQEAIGLFMDRCRRLGAITGATTIGVHHENKSGGLLGSIVFQNDSDFVYHVKKKDPNAPLSECEVHCEKLKDGTDGWTRNVTFVSVHTGADDSLVVDNIGTENVTPVSQTKPKRQTRERAAAHAFFDAVEAAWDEGKPFNDSNSAIPLKLNMTIRAMNIMDVGRAKAKELLDLWKDAGHLRMETVSTHTKQKGYKVLSRPWDASAEMAEMNAETADGVFVSD